MSSVILIYLILANAPELAPVNIADVTGRPETFDMRNVFIEDKATYVLLALVIDAVFA